MKSRALKPLLLTVVAAASLVAASGIAYTLTSPAAKPPAPVAGEIAALRAQGQSGLNTMLAALEKDPANAALRAAVDAVAAQKDADTSRLFWHTTLAEAQAAAEKSGKPILYLRLLGKLSDEYSCANSRFFRTALYADPKVAAYLRENFVLVWESERPVPLLTIDFGDGRTHKSTITGNSIHYVLDKNANIIDAMPGLYSPDQFLKVLAQARGFRPEEADAYHTAALNTISSDWGGQPISRMPVQPAAQAAPAAPVTDKKVEWRVDEVDVSKIQTVPVARQAGRAMANTRSKSMLIADRTMSGISPDYGRELARANFEADWARWEAAARSRPVKLSPQSVALMTQQLAPAKPSPAAFAAIVRRFESNIAMETARNDALMRSQIHAWLLQPGRPEAKTLGAINNRVYAELFRTPASDPWLGLLDPTAYSALTEQPAKN